MGAALTRGVQKHNVMACIKHYAANSIENSRFRVDVRMDERTLREVYLPHFKRCIDEGAASVMGAYNKFRGGVLLSKQLPVEGYFEKRMGLYRALSSPTFLGCQGYGESSQQRPGY